MDFFEDDQTSDQGPPDNIHIMPTAQQTWEVGATVDSECYLVAVTQDGTIITYVNPSSFGQRQKRQGNDDIIKSFFNWVSRNNPT